MRQRNEPTDTQGARSGEAWKPSGNVVVVDHPQEPPEARLRLRHQAEPAVPSAPATKRSVSWRRLAVEVGSAFIFQPCRGTVYVLSPRRPS